MPHLFLKWRAVSVKDVRGADVESIAPELIDLDYSGRLLSEILKMKSGRPISLKEAVDLMAEKKKEAFDRRRFGRSPGEFQWYDGHFVEWISSLGYHIEITGDEFEIIYPSQFVA